MDFHKNCLIIGSTIDNDLLISHRKTYMKDDIDILLTMHMSSSP